MEQQVNRDKHIVRPDEDIKIGRNDISIYVSVIVLNLSKYGKVTISSTGTNTFKAERIASMFKKIGIEEVKRWDAEETIETFTGNRVIPVLKICLSCEKHLNTSENK